MVLTRRTQAFERTKQTLSCLLFCLAIAGCQSMRPEDTLPDWSLQGRVAVKSYVLQRSINIHWRQRGERFDIHLTGPLGISVGRIEGDSKQAWLGVPGELRQAATDPDSLFRRHFGFSIPLSSVRHWVRGQMDPGLSYRTRDDHFLQAGWKIEYLGYQESLDTKLPRKVRISRPEASLTLLIRSWYAV